jgi:septum formation protein
VILAAPKTIILASSSDTRRQILEMAGVAVNIVRPRVDEEEIKQALLAERAQAGEIAEVLAEQKARSVSRQFEQDLVVGADQVLESEGNIFSKPADRDAARNALIALRGKEHRLYSCVCVLRNGQRLWHKLDSASLTMRNFSDDFLETYLDTMGDLAFTGPGSYRLEGIGAQLFSKISGDYFTILGLPLMALLDHLRVQGALES